MAPYRRRRTSQHSPRPLVAFLLIASFGILFAGCSRSTETESTTDEFSFTEQDIAKFREALRDDEDPLDVVGSGGLSSAPRLTMEGQEIEQKPVVDLSAVSKYDALRSGPGASEEDVYRVTNEFLNVRSAPAVTAEGIDRLDKGAAMKVLEFSDAAWAKVELSRERTGYVTTRYIAKMISEDQLAAEKKKFEGQYFVDFAFLNIRKSQDSNSEKIGELPGQTIIRPITIDGAWARVSYDGKEGYVAAEYLSPFLPNFLVRQSSFKLPIVHYKLVQDGMMDAMVKHLDAFKNAGFTLWTLRDFSNLLEQQQERDVRVNPNTIIVAVSGITPENVKEVSDVLRASGVSASLFLETRHLGIDGITEQMIQTLMANGHDLQSGSHSGDDLRSLTNAQVELEMQQSRKILEDSTKKTVFAFAYPIGGVNDRVAQLAAQSGYLFGVGSAPETTFTRAQFLNLPSILVTASMTNEDVLGLVKGE